MAIQHDDLWAPVAREYLRSIVPGFRPIARDLCERVGARPGCRLLDLGCGPGTAAFEARALGAAVIGMDPSPAMLALARERITGDPRAPVFLGGDALALPFSDRAFGAVVSNFGVIFAPGPGRAASEMARVLAAGGRLAISAWPAIGATGLYYAIVDRYLPPIPGTHDPTSWGDPLNAAAWLGPWFGSLEFTPAVVPFDASSPATAWKTLLASSGRVASRYRSLGPEARVAFDGDMLEYFGRFRREDGTIHWPREALVITGSRQGNSDGIRG